MRPRPFYLIGERINHAFATARRAWEARDPGAYQSLAKAQIDRGVDALTVNLAGTESFPARREDVLSFLPDLVGALQEVTSLPLAFDSPDLEYQSRALRSYDFQRGQSPILNSLSASRQDVDGLVALVREYDTQVIVLASERRVEGGPQACRTAQDVYQAVLDLVDLLRRGADRSNHQILVDPGLYPVLFDTQGRVSACLEAMRLVRSDPDLEGVQLVVGLSNVSLGVPATIRASLESAFLTLAIQAGLDSVLGNPDKNLRILPPDNPLLLGLIRALQASQAQGKHSGGATQARIIRELL